MRVRRERLQSLALYLRAVPGVPLAYVFWYRLAQACFVRLAMRAGGAGTVSAVYLRRGGGRGETVPGASDLDFFLVLAALPAEREMVFLKTFWRSYYRWRRIFPFFGEVLMGEEAELRQWLASPTVRSFEAQFSWKLLAGAEFRGAGEKTAEPEPRDAYSEALKCYFTQLQPVLKLRDGQLHQALRPWESGAVHLRHCAKATLDLFRLHYLSGLPPAKKRQIWRASRLELISLLPAARYGNLAPLRSLLLLEGPLFSQDPFELFSALLHRSARCLDDMADGLHAAFADEGDNGWPVSAATGQRNAVDRYSLSVRELFAERMLLRHSEHLSRAVLSESSTHLFFLFGKTPGVAAYRALLRDLRDVSFSFDRFSLAMPLSEAAFRELERSSVFDTPFHSFASHRESRLGADGSPETRAYTPGKAFLPGELMDKTFAELSFVLRFPPADLNYFLERMVGLVLGLRVASEQKQIAATFHEARARYRERFPERSTQLEQRLAPFLYEPSPGETEAWNGIFESLARFDEAEPGQGRRLRAQLENLRRKNREQASSPTLATDLWISLTPFLRMEMAALKEKYFSHRGQMKV